MSDRPAVDFGDLLIAVATDLDDIRLCVGCGADSTWAGLFVDIDDATVTATAWCSAPACEHDRTVLSAGQAFALPINHLPALRRPRPPVDREVCPWHRDSPEARARK